VTKVLKRLKNIIRVLKKTIVNVKYCYLFLAFFYPDLVKYVNNVKFRIELNYTKLRKRFLKKRKRVTVLNCDCI
jgi:hypothetical protein